MTIEVRIVRAERTSAAPTVRITNLLPDGTTTGNVRLGAFGHIACVEALFEWLLCVLTQHRVSEETESTAKPTQSYRPTQSWDTPLVTFQFVCAPEGWCIALSDIRPLEQLLIPIRAASRRGRP